MDRNKYYLYAFLGLFFIACLFVAIELTLKNRRVETIHSVETVTTKGCTLLERMYADVDSDGKDESIELYTSAKRSRDDRMEWDDGQRWLLLVRDEGKKFPLFDDYVQLGELEFWVCTFNKSKKISPGNKDLERHIYVMRTGNSIEFSDYYWDKQSLCYKKEIVFNPPDQWGTKSSTKYSTYDPALIEPVPSGSTAQ